MKEVPVVKPAVDWALDRSEQHPTKTEEPNKVNTNANKPEIVKPEIVKPDIVKPEIVKPSFAETNLGVYLNENSSTITSIVKTLLAKSAGTLLGYFGLFIGFLMIPIYLYYFLKESAAIKENWQNYVPLKASKFKTEVVETLKEINGYTISFFRGQVLVAFIDGILVGVGLMLFGLPYGLVIGIVMAFLGVIPFIGNLLCMIPACLIAYIHFSDPAHHDTLWGILGSSPWAYVGAVLAIFVIVQQINSLVTAPKIVGDSVGLHPMTVIFSMLFWSLILGGFVGALLAVPLTAAVKVIFVRYVWERRIMEQAEESPEDSEDQPDQSDEETPEEPTPATA